MERLLARNVGETAATFLASEIATQIVLRVGAGAAQQLGISFGVLGTGAAYSLSTLGVSFVAGVIVDYLLDFIYAQHGKRHAGYIAIFGILNGVDIEIRRRRYPI